MTSEKLAKAIEKEQKLLAGYRKKRAEYDEKIKKSEGRLHQYEMMQRSEKFSAVAAVVAENGLSIEDVLAAIQNGDLLALQERMEAAQAESQEEENAENVEDSIE